jgi:hypothetical protein
VRGHSAVVHMVGGASEMRAVGRELEDALMWMEVDRSGLSGVRCQAAIEEDSVRSHG